MRFLLDEGNTALWVSSAAIAVWVVQYSILVRWWANTGGQRGTRYIGITLVGLAVCLLLVYIPSLLALAWPAQFAHFATARWYQWLAILIVNATAGFMITRIVTWEYLRRHKQTLPERLGALEAEMADLRQQLGEGSLT